MSTLLPAHIECADPACTANLLSSKEAAWLSRSLPATRIRASKAQGLRCGGLGKSVQGRVAFRRRNAAHDQITERKYSIAWFGITPAGEPFPVAQGHLPNSVVHLNYTEIRPYVTQEIRNNIAALRNILNKLESKAVPGPDEEAFSDLKRILNHRIDQLEHSAPVAIPDPIKTAGDAD